MHRNASRNATPQADEARQARRAEAARLLLSGRSFAGEGDDDPFEGMTPKVCVCVCVCAV